VIDRWHVLKNLREAIERVLSHTPVPEETAEEARQHSSPRPKRTSGERVRSAGSRARRLALYRASSLTSISKISLCQALKADQEESERESNEARERVLPFNMA
jgi:hypothetical protein